VAPKQEERFLTGDLVKAGDCVLLVMPQDSEAPKGRLILPQVQVLRELLDRGCNSVCCTPDSLSSALARVTPDLVITDSQVFGLVNQALPASMPLTSFSVLLAGAKGDIRIFVEGAAAIDRLKPGDRVLIAEACTHVPDTEDIGRVKIPALLRKKAQIEVDIAAGNDFPEDLSPYSLIIHCGACVATRTLVQARIKKALRAGVPITNYGIAIAKLQGLLDRIEISGRSRE
jgi:[FeFe] hydrogenase H-cluster maturation GTPase HydF